VTNKWLTSIGLTRRQSKPAVLRGLAQAGLIAVNLQPRRSPWATILYPEGHQALPYLHGTGALSAPRANQ
jgi:hypothetical protein